jgi:predicted TIM-barrel fold metal-dependent hydrolase
MHRREFLKLGPMGALAGAAFPQGREFRKNPPFQAPTSQRIIDMHVHDFFQERKPDQPEFTPQLNNSRPDGIYQMNASWEQFQFDMGPVYKAVLLHVAQKDVGTKGNDRNAAIAKRWPEKIIPFGSVNPNYPDALAEFERGVKQLGLKGFKMSPIYQSFHPMDPGACRIYARAQEWGVPLIFHTATAQADNVPLKYANPVLFDDVAYAFPRLKIIMAHMGHPWQRECIVTMRKHPNVYTELSGTFYRPWDFYQSMMLAMEWGQTHKILFGTDWPITTARETMAGIRAANQFAKTGLPRIPEEVLEGIIYRDSLSLLGLA